MRITVTDNPAPGVQLREIEMQAEHEGRTYRLNLWRHGEIMATAVVWRDGEEICRETFEPRGSLHSEAEYILAYAITL